MPITDIFLMLLANLGWGFNFIAGKAGASHFQPLLFTSLRFFVLLLLMLPWLKPAPGLMKPLLRVAILLGVFHFSMVFIGLNAAGNIASVAIAMQLYVPFSAILAAVFLKEKITLMRIIAIATAFAGILIIGFDPIVFNHIDALLWTTGSALIMAIATILMRQCPNLGVFRLQAWIALTAAPSLLLLSLIFEDGQMEILRQSQLSDFWSPVYSAIGASIMGHGIVYLLLGRHPVSIVTPLMLLAPIFGSVLGIFFFGDILGLRLITGGGLTLLGILLVTINPAAIQQHKMMTGLNFKKKR